MSNERTKRQSARRIIVAVISILIIVGIMIVAKVFLFGVQAGVVFVACIIALYWISRSMLRKR